MFFSLKINIIGPEGLLIEDRVCHNLREGIHIQLPPCFDVWIGKVDNQSGHMTMFIQNRSTDKPNHFRQLDVPLGQSAVINAQNMAMTPLGIPTNFKICMGICDIYENLRFH